MAARSFRIGSIALALLASPLARAGEAPRFEMPVACVVGTTCAVQNYPDDAAGPGRRDHACGLISYDGHTGTDIRLADIPAMRAGVAVLAAAPGTVLRIRDGEVDALKSGPPQSQGRACGNGVVVDHGGGWQSLYCHLANGSVRVRPGESVAAGQPIGRVGLSGHTQFPHLHFELLRDGKTIDPYTTRPLADDDSCAVSTQTLWSTAAAAQLAYRPAAILNAGFADAPVDLKAAEAGDIRRPSRDAAALVAYVRVIGVRAGDRQGFRVTGPDGAVLVDQTDEELKADKILWLAYAGRRRPAAGWTSGRYRAAYRLTRAGGIVAERNFEFDMP